MRIHLEDDFYYLPVGNHSTIYDAQNDYVAFEKFDIHSRDNISKILGTEGHYIWLRAEFNLPEKLRYTDLGLFISYLHFADEVYINGNFAGAYGAFPPNERSSLFESHFYHLPRNFLKQVGTNSIYIKVWSHGKGHISDDVFIGMYDDALSKSETSSFMNSRFYIMFEGGMFCAMILYLLLYLWRRKEKAYLDYALLNLSTMFFLTPFFAPEVPWYSTWGIPYLSFMKFALCICINFVIFFTARFITRYLKVNESKYIVAARYALLAIPVVVIMAAPSYDFLIKLTPFVLFMLACQIGIAVYFLIRKLMVKESRASAVVLLLGFSPTLTTMLLDLIVRVFSLNYSNTYLTIFGWQLTIVLFIFTLTIRFNRAIVRNEYLTENLKNEVGKQTEKLSEMNEKLSGEVHRANADLEMASIVQQKFFPYPSETFKGWDIAVCYNPVAKVSGDLYDYYHDGNKLDGFSLFDVSGHGISASLITMLSKGIIFREFERAKEKFRLLSDALNRINEQIIEAKGEIENYLTGLLFRFSEFDPNDICRVEMSNAGHPNPLFYSAKDNSISEIMRDDTQEQYGAIGIKSLPVCFPDLIFFMGVGDVLVFFTDGLTESMNTEREEFGKERVMEILKNSAPKDAQSILEDLIDGLYLFMGSASRDDDLSIIVLKRTNSKGYIEYDDFDDDYAMLEEV